MNAYEWTQSRVAPCLLAILLVASATAALADPAEPGPYAVGVMTLPLADPDRVDPILQAPRPLLTELWYPADESARGMPPTKFTDFYLGGRDVQMNTILTLAFKFDVTRIDTTFKTVAVRDAPPASGRFPLVVFSHGNGGMRAQNTFWCDHLASHGYIVAAADHTRNACATSLDGKVIPYDLEGRGQSAIDRPKDVSVLIDLLARRNADPDFPLHGRIDLEHIGVAGHSFGGFTAMAAAALDTRVDAIVPMAAVVPEFSASSTKPLLLFIATEDDTIGEKGNAGARAYFEATEAPKCLVEFKDGGHYTFSDMYQINPRWGDGVGSGTRVTDGTPLTYIDMKTAYALVNGYSTAFLDKFLKGDLSAGRCLNAESPRPDVVVRAQMEPNAPR